MSAGITDYEGQDRGIARIAGALFIIATAASLLSTVFLKSAGSSDYLSGVAANGGQVALGVLIRFIAAFASAAIAISLYPVLRRYRKGLALGAVGFRVIEATFYVLGAISVLLLLTLSQEFVKTGAADPGYFNTSGTLLKALDDWSGLAGVFAFYVGGLLYYCVFYQTRLVSRWLSAWGVVGVTLGTVAALLILFGATGSMSTVQIVLNIPIGINEIVLAVWLIVKGFRPSAVPAPTGSSVAV
ncbi:MAG: DUF4386 domain-containing protein [Actinobacteria bacterium]|nr:DUF4386 domain-containing protein [Actinomycetota bacterium]